MRRLVCLLAAALLLVGCGGSDAASPEATATATNASLDDITVTGGDGEKPVLDLGGTVSLPETTTRVLSEGEGAAVEDGQKVSIEYVGVNGANGKEFDTSYPNGPTTFTLDDSVIPGFAEGLVGVPVGSRVLVGVAPADGYGPQGGIPDAGIGPDDTLLFVIDVRDAESVLARAQGEAVTPAEGLPTVALAEDGEPTITLPAGPPPDELVVQPLVRGEGAEVQQGQTISAHYVGVTWPGGEVFDSSWERGSPAQFQIGTGAVIAGWDEGLVGTTVGSQVLLVVPPDKGYGEDGNEGAGISGTDTLVFVVDVLDVSGEPTG